MAVVALELLKLPSCRGLGFRSFVSHTQTLNAKLETLNPLILAALRRVAKIILSAGFLRNPINTKMLKM